MRPEGVLLTGGASSRMGQDKAAIRFDGEQLAVRIARSLDTVCDRVTIIGREPIPGYLLIKDLQEFAGPLVALSQLQPS